MTLRALVLAAVLPLATASSAGAAGGPVPPVQDAAAAPALAPVSYTATRAPGGTVLERVPGDRRSAPLAGVWGLPGAAYDGSVTGVSADGRRVVLARVTRRFPQKTTRLAVFDGRTLRLERRVTLRGSFAVDAVSPTGRWVYLIRYARTGDPLDYEVRAYDVDAGRLLGQRIVDPDEPVEAMAGFPVARAYSPGGRWAYTLYQRPEGEPFVHALDTAGVTARCIDVPELDETTMDLYVDGTTLTVADASGPRLQLDTRTLEPAGMLPGLAALLGFSAAA